MSLLSKLSSKNFYFLGDKSSLIKLAFLAILTITPILLTCSRSCGKYYEPKTKIFYLLTKGIQRSYTIIKGEKFYFKCKDLGIYKPQGHWGTWFQNKRVGKVYVSKDCQGGIMFGEVKEDKERYYQFDSMEDVARRLY